MVDETEMKTIQVPKDATVIITEARAEGVVIKAADIAAANEAAAAAAAHQEE